MSKPTQEIIEASKELYNLGVKKVVPDEGDWHEAGRKRRTVSLCTYGKDCDLYNIIVIPPLEWCLEWLQRRRVKADLYCVDITDDQPMRWKVATFSDTMSSSPHLAVLKAMIAVKESDNES